MAPTPPSAVELFDIFPEPVILADRGKVLYANPAASGLLPGLEAGGSLPEFLAQALDGVQAPALVCTAREDLDLEITLRETPAGTLILPRLREQASSELRLDLITAQLRQQMSSMAAALQQLDPQRGAWDPVRTAKYLSVANQGLYRLLRLCGHLEAVGQLPCHLRSMDLAAFVGQLADEIGSVCRLGGWSFRYDLQVSAVLTMADDRLLEQMILALVSNAMKAAERGGTLGLRLSLRQGSQAVLTVWDGGPGLEPEELGTLFDGGTGPDLTHPGAGLGLGMDLVQRIAALHGGTVMAETRPGQGLRAAVSLPIRPPAQEEMVLRSPRTDNGGFSPILVELSDLLPPELYSHPALED